MSRLRAHLAASRPRSAAYAATLASLPADITHEEGRVGRVTIYPVKGLGGLDVERARVTPRGLVDVATGLADRGGMLGVLDPGVTGEGKAFDAFALTNRIEDAISLTRARLDGATLVYEAPGVPALRLDPASLAPRDGPVVRTRLYDGGPVVDTVRDDGELAQWVRALLRAHPRRRRFDAADIVTLLPTRGHERPVGDKHRAGQAAQTLFGDGGHVLIASSSTLAWMNDRLRAAGGRAIDMAAFRPNLVLHDLPANAEDVIGEVEFDGADGAAPFLFASFCVRCDATRIDVHTGRKPDREPLAFLAHERPPRDGEPNSATFAINAVARVLAHGRTIRAGDRVRVLRERDG